MTIAATYVSVWDNGLEIRTNCQWDPQKHVATLVKSVDVAGVDMLTREYVELPDGTTIQVDSLNETEEGIPVKKER